jgi:hypothetical protein
LKNLEDHANGAYMAREEKSVSRKAAEIAKIKDLEI